jgi:hypothetical protein
MLGVILSTLLAGTTLSTQVPSEKPYVPIGLFIGRIEEGARIFTPARLLPMDHPEALGHDFPTLQQLHGTEFPALLWLGAQSGLRLWSTLQRYPREPSPTWPYAAFRPPPDTTRLATAAITHRPKADAPLPGLRAVLYDGEALVLFIVDTRSLSLADRGMRIPTSMGLDISRKEFLTALNQASRFGARPGLWSVVFDP